MKWLLLVPLLVGCASAGIGGPGERAIRDAEMCLRSGPCLVMQVYNRNTTDARLYLNGSRLAFVNGLSEGPVFIPRWRLDNAGCAVIQVRLMAGPSVLTSRECPREGMRLVLDIDPSSPISDLHAWLTPYPADE